MVSYPSDLYRSVQVQANEAGTSREANGGRTHRWLDDHQTWGQVKPKSRRVSLGGTGLDNSRKLAQKVCIFKSAKAFHEDHDGQAQLGYIPGHLEAHHTLFWFLVCQYRSRNLATRRLESYWNLVLESKLKIA